MTCIFSNSRMPNGCRILNVQKCNEMECEWSKSVKEYLESLHRARMNYIRFHGKDEYWKHVPNDWLQRYDANEKLHDLLKSVSNDRK